MTVLKIIYTLMTHPFAAWRARREIKRVIEQAYKDFTDKEGTHGTTKTSDQ